MKHIIILLILIFSVLEHCVCQTVNDTLISNLKNSFLYKESHFDGFINKERYFPKFIKASILPEFLIRFERQSAISIRAKGVEGKKYTTQLCNFDSYMIDPIYGDLSTKCFFQIGEHDFNNDDISEIVIVFGIKGEYLECKIFKYHEPANLIDSGRDENWSLIGVFEYGYSKKGSISKVDENKIHFQYGPHGFVDSFIYVEGKFIQFE